jgi:molybdopterin-binding protein
MLPERRWTLRLSARNQLKGTVKRVTHGAVETEVLLELSPGVDIVATITKASAEQMGLKAGDAAWAIVKASNVIIGVE